MKHNIKIFEKIANFSIHVKNIKSQEVFFSLVLSFRGFISIY